MRRRLNKITSLMLILCLTFGVFAVSAGSAYAESKKWTILANEDRWVGDPDNYVSVCDLNSFDNKNGPVYATVTSVKSSKDSVLAVKEEKLTFEDHKEKAYILKSKKAGKATITVKFKKPSGKTGTLKKTITVRKYPYEIKSLKVNGKSVKISKNKFNFSKKTNRTNVTVKMALKKGWKVSSIYCYRYKKNGKTSEVKVTKKMIRKGLSISFPKKYDNMLVSVYMTDGKDRDEESNSHIISYDVSFYRP